MVDNETAKYILNYFPHLLNVAEKIAIRHIHSLTKLDGDVSEGNNLAQACKKIGWLTEDQTAFDLLKDGFEPFQSRIATRLLETHPHRIFLNYCPQCSALARTPYAKQCRYCGFSWHSTTVARFRCKSFFEVAGRCNYISGEILSGKINIDNILDLTMVGLATRPAISAVDFMLQRKPKHVWEDVCLGFTDLDEESREFLESLDIMGKTVDILGGK